LTRIRSLKAPVSLPDTLHNSWKKKPRRRTEDIDKYYVNYVLCSTYEPMRANLGSNIRVAFISEHGGKLMVL